MPSPTPFEPGADTSHPPGFVIDPRWAGQHGIGRYSSEIINRLTLPAASLRGGDPRSLLDVANPHRLALSPRTVLYSPSYRVGFTRSRQIVTVHDLIHLSSTGKRARLMTSYYNQALRPAIKSSGLVLTVSPTSKEVISEWLNDDSVKVVNTGNGCSPDFREEGPRFSSRNPYFLVVGNAKPHKNLTLAASAIAPLGTVDLIMVGPDEAALHKLAIDSGIPASRVRILNNLTDNQLAELYRGALALMFPSRMEGFGLPVVEASRCNCPVIFLDACASVQEIMGRSGIRVSSDASEWTDAARSIIDGYQPSIPGTDHYNWDSVAARVQTTLLHIGNQ